MHGGKEVLGKKCLRRKQQGARWKRGIREEVFEEGSNKVHGGKEALGKKCLRRKQQGARWKRGIREKVFEKETTRCTVEKRY